MTAESRRASPPQPECIEVALRGWLPVESDAAAQAVWDALLKHGEVGTHFDISGVPVLVIPIPGGSVAPTKPTP